MVDTMVTPDIIYLNIMINEKDTRNRMSVEEQEGRMLACFYSLGIDVKRQLLLSDMASNFKRYFLKNKDIIKFRTYNLKLFDARTAGNVLLRLEEIGISNVFLDRTEYSKIEELKLELKSIAVAKARRQAEYLVKPLQQSILSALHIVDRYFGTNRDDIWDLNEVVVTTYSGSSKQDNEPIEVDFKPIRVVSEVSVKFAFQ